MATIKSFTDLSQSKVLAKILPFESADMYYSDVPVREWVDKTDISKGTHVVFKSQIFAIENLRNHEIGEGDVYAWSLTALLDVLPNNENISTTLSKGGYRISALEYTNSWFVDYEDETNGLNNCVTSADNPVDACVVMIEKLHKIKML